MSKFGVSQSVRRIEDHRFLTGQGRYVDDITPEGALFVTYLRSPVAHAVLNGIDTSEAASMPGVKLILTAADLEGSVTNAMDYSVLDIHVRKPSSSATRPILAEGKLRFVGEPIAAVVAETRLQGLDAAEAIELDYTELPAHVDTALGGEQIHDDAPDNQVFDFAFGDEAAVDAAFKSAAHTTRMEQVDNRIISNPMETRACYAEYEDGKLHVAISGQGVWGSKAMIADKLGMDPKDVRITNPDVGGGFGTKGFNYPEYFSVAEAARRLGQPCRWMADRSEGMLTDNGGRDLITVAEAAFDENYRLTALRFDSVANMGAYSSGYAQFIQTDLQLKVLTGIYDIQNVFLHVDGVYTNTTQIDAYRGAGRPEAIYQLERLMDYSAKVLGQDPIELRQKNWIKRDQFPYKTVTGELYDVGDFDKVMARALVEADIAGFPARKAESAKAGKFRGIGLSFYIESILGDPAENTKIEFAEDGMVNLYVGTQSNGQGHETVFAQILHSRAGIPFDKIRFIQGDSDLIPKGGGTGGSRSVTMQGNSINSTADIMISNFRELAEEELETSATDINFEDGHFTVAGTDKSVSLIALAETARAKGREDLLVTANEYTVPGRSYPNGAHFAEVEVDPVTGVTECVKYTIVDDFGLLMNPMLAEGQAHGGVAQGIGQAITEQVIYDKDGQLLTGSFMDYAMPRADDLPYMDFHTELVPSTANEIGMKGCGEAGTVGAMAAVTNAALDAVWEHGVTRVDMPMTPLAMWERLQQPAKAAE